MIRRQPYRYVNVVEFLDERILADFASISRTRVGLLYGRVIPDIPSKSLYCYHGVKLVILGIYEPPQSMKARYDGWPNQVAHPLHTSFIDRLDAFFAIAGVVRLGID